MANPIVTISGCMPDKDSVNIGAGEELMFKSGDGKAYYIDFGHQNADVSSDLPLAIPSNGSVACLKVRADLQAGTYMYAIQNDQRSQCWPVADSAPGDVPPGVIVT